MTLTIYYIKAQMDKIKKVYIDSRYKTTDSVSNSD